MAHPAVEFLRLLDPSPDAHFNIETYSDVATGAGKPRSDALARQFRDQSIKDIAVILPKLQAQNVKGAGIFIAVNSFNGARRKDNLARIRGVHADLDDVDEETLKSLRSTLPPTIEVQSSGPRNWHFYWLLSDGEEMTADEAESINRGLVELGADRAAVDITRLLRLPGFAHMKQRIAGGATSGDGETQLGPNVKLVSSGSRYASSQIAVAFPRASKRSKDDERYNPGSTQKNGFSEMAKVRLQHADVIQREVDHQETNYPKIWLACWSSVLISTKRMVGRRTASHIASASTASFLPRFTYGLT